MDFLLIAFLILLNAVFAMSEMALSASRKARLAAMAEAGDKGSRAALDLMDHPTQFLSSVQVGITSIGMLNGIIGEAAFSSNVSSLMQQIGIPAKAAEISATAFVVAVITYITIVFGELVPKRIGQLHPEAVARLVARPMVWVAIAAKPFVKLLSVSTQAILQLLRVDTTGSRAVTEEEIAASLVEGVDAGLIEAHEHQMVQNVFLLDNRRLASLMLPRSDIAWFDATDTLDKAIQKAGATGHSWYPVCRGGLDDVVGVVNVSYLLGLLTQDKQDFGADVSPSVRNSTVATHALPAVFVPETLTGMELLEQFRARSSRIVFVVDEYGVVQGLMTPMDMLEAITGELQPFAPVDAWAIQRDDGSWLLDGAIPVSELKARLDIRDLPDEDKKRYFTVAGLMQSISGRLLNTTDLVECAGWRFEVVDLDGRRIDKVLATALKETELQIRGE